MQLLHYVYIFVILISCCAHLIKPQPVSMEGGTNSQQDMQRPQRQVVQPTWLTDKSLPLRPIDGIVHKTQKNLKETAELRSIIQKAVNEGTYAITMDQNQPSQAPRSKSASAVSQQPATQHRPSQPVPLFGPLPLGLFNSAQLPIPTMAPRLPSNQQQPNPIQRMWSDFMKTP